jgi:hypothetical protein
MVSGYSGDAALTIKFVFDILNVVQREYVYKLYTEWERSRWWEEAPYKRASVDGVVFGERKSKVVYMSMFHWW